MAWNPFKAIGNVVGRILGRGEQAPGPAPAPETAPTPEVSPPEVVERRGGLAGLWDRVTGADRRREEATERERQLEERERQLEERERHLEERERAVSPPTEPAQAPEPAVSSPSPPTPGPAPEPVPAPEGDLPKFIGGDAFDYQGQDERFFGADSDIERRLQESVDDFIMDRGGLDGLTVDAREWLESPTLSQPFSEYWHSAGYTAEQVLDGMKDIRNIQISEGDDGDIHIEFDYDSEIDEYEIHGHASN